MKLRHASYCPDCDEIFVRGKDSNSCPSCTNRVNIIPLSSFFTRAGNHICSKECKRRKN